MLHSGGGVKRKITEADFIARQNFNTEERKLEKEIAKLKTLMNELTRMRRLTGDKPNQTIIFHLETIESQMQLPFSEVFFPEAKRQLTNVIEISKPIAKSVAQRSWNATKPVAKSVATSVAKFGFVTLPKFAWNLTKWNIERTLAPNQPQNMPLPPQQIYNQLVVPPSNVITPIQQQIPQTASIPQTTSIQPPAENANPAPANTIQVAPFVPIAQQLGLTNTAPAKLPPASAFSW